MKTSGGKTHQANAMPPEKFRAIATGIGQSQAMSHATGLARMAKVVPTIKCPAAVPASEGY